MLSHSDVHALVRRFYDPFRDGDMSIFDDVLALTWHNDPADPRGGDPRMAMRSNVTMIRTALPDLTHEQEAVVVESTSDGGFIAAVRSRLSGTQEGPFMGIEPTGRRVILRTMDMHRITTADRIVETWHLEDFFGLFRQLDATPQFPAKSATS